MRKKPFNYPNVTYKKRKESTPKQEVRHSFEGWVLEKFKADIIMRGSELSELSILSNVTVEWLTLFDIPYEEAEEIEKEALGDFINDSGRIRIDPDTFPELEKLYKKSLACVLYKRNLSHIQHLPAIKNIEITYKINGE